MVVGRNRPFASDVFFNHLFTKHKKGKSDEPLQSTSTPDTLFAGGAVVHDGAGRLPADPAGRVRDRPGRGCTGGKRTWAILVACLGR